METWYVTGSDSRSFLHVQALLRSMAHHSPRVHVGVCDFGLSPDQRAELDALGVLIKRPQSVPVGAPWARSFASLHHYVPGARTMVWIDPRCLVVGPIAPHIEALVRSWGEQDRVGLFTDPENPTLSRVLTGAQLEAFGLPGDTPLFGVDLVISRCPQVWASLAELAPKLVPVGRTHQIWFNALLTAHRIPLQSLDGGNLFRTGAETRTLTVSGARVLDGNRPILLVHPDGVPAQQRISDGMVQAWHPLPHPGLEALQEQALSGAEPAHEALQVTA